jgi:carboxypeptidase C (cathepsin A)
MHPFFEDIAMKYFSALIIFSFCFSMGLPTAFGQNTPATTRTTTTTEPKPEESPVVQKHSVNIGGKNINYTTTTGFLPIKNSQSGEVEARIFFMAYTMDNPSAKRPLMFSFNGGPGSASVWLHLGALGPKRVKMLDDGMMPPSPYEMVTNEHTWFTETDLVFIDPVGTGYSRASKPELASKFFSVNGDIDSIAEFIRLYLGRYERWNSPIFLVGESYGTARAAGLADVLFEKGVGINGIALVSAVMSFQTVRFAEGNDLPLKLIFPSYAATAWYHKKLSPELQGKPLKDILAEAEKFAIGPLATAFLKGDRMTAAERREVIVGFSKLSGLSEQFIGDNNLRIDLQEFLKELMRGERKMVGRLDSRFTGIDRAPAGNSPDFDPSMTAIRPPYTSVFNDYVRKELGFKSDTDYFILGGGITSPWNWNVNNGYTDTSLALNTAMRKNPYMKVFIASGYYDMATPYFAADYNIAAMNLDPELRKNISFSYYESGHMMYIEIGSLKKIKDDIQRFIRASVPR